ncbi:PREDICTED: B3 domain-containing protein REM10-like [Nicotiana attenuata]|uniref:B3 domain-containing protein REM10-like n=1 Tax=Nicotiana attenuata TaxID=49451 RepID=UPI000904EE16|nr:PREDICTED: B3 domain-containing protein REM10-like [Nicotiana attenuata]
MKIVPPNKPHFFKPILPGFKNGLKIPVGFLKYLKGHKNEHAILRRGSKQWRVKVNGRRFEADWADFAQQHDLQLGDVLIFRHEGNMEFEVTIFYSSGSVREYLQEEVHTVEETSKNEFEEKASPSIKLSNKASSHAEATTLDKLPFGQSHFVCTIRPYCLSKGFLFLPQQFAKANGLTNKKCDLIIRDGRQRSWNLKLSSSRRPRVYIIGDGLRKFIVDNCLKEGDRIMFEVVTNGKIPIWKFQVVTNGGTPIREFQDIRKKPSNMSPLNAKVSTSTSTSGDGHDLHLPYFISNIKPYCTKKSVLYLPLDFLKSNGLMDRKCEMILKNEEDRSWSVWLGREGRHFGIVSGWSKFRTVNGLQVGDAYKFELIKNGEKPIAHFHCKYSEKVAKRGEGQ